MNTKTLLQELLGILSFRRVGNTTALIRGLANSSDAILIAPTLMQAQEVFQVSGSWGSVSKRTASLESLKRLRGRTNPVLFEHTAVQEIAQRSLDKIQELEEEIRRLEEKQSLAPAKPRKVKIVRVRSKSSRRR